MFTRSHLLLTLALLALLLTSASGATAQDGAVQSQAALGTAFTYQGQLTTTGTPVTGSCDMAFRLYDAASAGNQIGGVITTTVPVTNGLFYASLDFGNVFDGNARWLGIAVKCGTDSAFTTLSTRQPLTAAPYAQYAIKAGSVPSPYYPLLRPQTLDLATVDPGLVGFIGGFTDGRYGYFVPNGGNTSGKVARVDLQNFTIGGVTTLDLATVDSGLKGFQYGFTDGRYGYFVPTNNGVTYFGKVARIDLQNFTTGGVTVLDLETVDAGLKGFVGGFTDGRYGYFVPYTTGVGVYSGKMARVDLQNFTTGGVTTLDLATVDIGLKGFHGGFTDGRYGYFEPNMGGTSGKIARVDLQNFNTGGVTILDLASVDTGLKGFIGGFSDGRYGYFVPFYDGNVWHGKLTRVDLQNFTVSGVTILDLMATNAGLRGFRGGFTDGRYGYLVPYDSTGSIFSGKVARVDLQNFTTSGVTWLDMALTDSGLTGFNGGFTDGRYGYFVPFYNGVDHGKVARIQLFSGAGAP